MRQRASAVSTAPTTTRRGDGTSASAKIRPSSSSRTVWLRSAEIASSPAATIASASSSGTSPRGAVGGHERVRAGVVAVDHGDARRALGGRLPALVALDPDPDLAAAGEADVPGLVVRDAVEDELRRAALRARSGPRRRRRPRRSRPRPSRPSRRASRPRTWSRAGAGPSGACGRRVASATSSPRVRQRSAVRRVSSFMRVRPQPTALAATAWPFVDLLQHLGERLERAQVVAGQEVVDVGQRGLHAGDQRAVALAAGERVRSRRRGAPPGAGAPSRSASSVGIAALPAVRGDHDDGAARQRPPAPDVVEGLQVLADARAAGPVGHGARGVARARDRGRGRRGAA